ncbi:MAG: alpha/beta hydrolase fold domain-containing protein [Actinomycetota bacterium]
MPDDHSGVGRAVDTGRGGWLSTAARERLDRPFAPPQPVPDLTDTAAVAAWRQRIHAGWLHGDPGPSDCGHRPDVLAGVRVLRTDQGPAATDPVVLYVHGGGYALGSPEVALPITTRLAGVEPTGARAGPDVVSVDHRLAPEHPHPAAVDDVLAVYRALRTEQPPRPIAMAGDSAGANVALAATLAMADGSPSDRPIAVVLLSPHLDLADDAGLPPVDDPSRDLRPADARRLQAAYRGRLPPIDPAVSPLRASADQLASLPPVLI